MRYLFLLLLSCISLGLQAQDWIVVNTRDTIYCHILAINPTNILYKTVSSEPPVSIAKDLVLSYRQDEMEYYPAQINETEERKLLLKLDKKYRSRGFRFGFGAGYTYRLAKAPNGSSAAVQEHIKKVKSGFHIKVDAMYFFGRFFGLGAKYTYSNAKARTDKVNGYTPMGYPYYGEVSDNISIHFIGLHPTARFGKSNGPVRVLLGITAGYIAVENRTEVGFPFTLKGSTFGLSADLSMEFQLISQLYFSAGAELSMATINRYNYDDGRRQGVVTFNKNNADNLWRIDATGGLRFYL
jgi:hypothetical protein